MEREFILLPEFEKACKRLEITENDIREIENYICINPNSGDIIPGTGGIRKLRWGLKGKGKRGSSRIIYLDLIYYQKVYFVTAYAKNEKSDLSKEEQNTLKKLVSILENQLKNGSKS